MVSVVNRVLDGRLYYPVWDGCVQCPLGVYYFRGDDGHRLIFRLFRVLFVDGVYEFRESGVCDLLARGFSLDRIRSWLGDGSGDRSVMMPVCLCYGMRLVVWDWKLVGGDLYSVGDALFVFLSF